MRRRWFQFGLGTVFVAVTVFAVWLGWELKYIRERKAFLLRVQAQGSQTVYADDPLWKGTTTSVAIRVPRIPFWRRWLGDRPVAIPGWPFQETMSADFDEQKMKALNDEILRLFPEAIEYIRATGGA